MGVSGRAPYFRDGTGGWFLLRRADVFTPSTLADAMPIARAIAESVSPETLDPAAQTHELARLLATGEAVVCRVARAPRLMEDPEIVDLVDIVEPESNQPKPAVATWFEARIVDAHGQPIAGIELTWLHDGNRERKSTNAEGVARLENVFVRSAAISIADTDPLRTALREAWSRPSDTPPLRTEDGVQVLHYRDAMLGPVLLSPETPTTVSIQPFVTFGRLVGMLFDTDRDFLLPLALSAIAELRDLYDRCEPKRVLIVGHTDATAQPEYNAALSLVRAESVRAYLTDDVDAWLARYGDVVGQWGEAEDLYMLSALPDWSTRPAGADPVTWFQETRGLQIDGDAGEETRRALITEYMQRDGTTLPEGVVIETHGCGEAFPLDATGHEIDEAPTDGVGDPIDRRVEVFFFGDSLGVQPPAPGETSGAGSTEYLSWRQRAQMGYEQVFGAEAIEIVLLDEHGEPTPHARYSLRLAVGTTIEGQLDENGTARIDRLPAGVVEVDFPDLECAAAVSGRTALDR
jgi:outer membrane protein OmpA-like peptidoglycan-associated protein